MDSRFAVRLLVLLGVGVTGLATQAHVLAEVAFAVLGLVVALRFWSLRTEGTTSSDWPVVAVLGSIGGGCLAMSVYFVALSSAPVLTRGLLGVIALIPALYFLLCTWFVGYAAVTGHRDPRADRVDKVFGALNRNVGGDRRRR